MRSAAARGDEADLERARKGWMEEVSLGTGIRVEEEAEDQPRGHSEL